VVPFKEPERDELDMTYQVLKEATGLKKPGSSSGSGSGSGFHGSSQTLHSQHEMTPTRVGRSNPAVNIVPGSSTHSHSGSSTPGAPSMAAQIMGSNASSSGKLIHMMMEAGMYTSLDERRKKTSHQKILYSICMHTKMNLGRDDLCSAKHNNILIHDGEEGYI